MADLLSDVAVIGAGLGGCALALALSAHHIPVAVYEARSAASEPLVSGVLLTPNGLSILDRLGVFARIRDRCYVLTHRVIKNEKDETIRKTRTSGDELYGYSNHRIWRKVLLDEMKEMLAERNVKIKYESKFGGIVSDDPGGVTFRINEDDRSASLLIGSDGIYSSLRRYLAPDIQPEYTGTVGIFSHIKRASVAWPYDDYEHHATIQGKPAAIFFLPEDPEVEVIMIGMQVKYPEQSKEDLERLQADKDELIRMYRKDYDEWGPTVCSIIDRVSENKESCFIWPYMKMPKLERWYSGTGRVVLVGDGAHAVPPSSGQGVNQALEDVYSLTLVLEAMRGEEGAKILDALAFWQNIRQQRIDAIIDWATNSQNVERLPEAERKKVEESKAKGSAIGRSDDMSWLYKPCLEDDVSAWINGRGSTL